MQLSCKNDLWYFLGNIGQLFIPSSGHTDSDMAKRFKGSKVMKNCINSFWRRLSVTDDRLSSTTILLLSTLRASGASAVMKMVAVCVVVAVVIHRIGFFRVVATPFSLSVKD